MTNTIKYYIKNRFMWVFYAWAMILVAMLNCNPYINVVLFFVGFMSVTLAFAYIEDDCTLNAQERLFMKKLSSMLDG